MVRVTLSCDEEADQLREQASSCRNLARNARTELGSTALLTADNQFESDAFRLDRQGQVDGGDEIRGRLRAALARQDELWLRNSTMLPHPRLRSDTRY